MSSCQGNLGDGPLVPNASCSFHRNRTRNERTIKLVKAMGESAGLARATSSGRRSKKTGAGRYPRFAQPPKSLFSQPKKPPP